MKKKRDIRIRIRAEASMEIRNLTFNLTFSPSQEKIQADIFVVLNSLTILEQ